MKRTHQRAGSALVIVLGILSLMIISAVGFASYMRYARLPSSFLRRSSASRLLVKAALTEAIDAIDRTVGNNPHPGVGNARYDANLENIWIHHVFTGTNALARVEDTVSPLTLEGLAYIPPPLVNEARYYSRRSMSAVWQPLGFDTGRYAWCAIDVSDCFDVNRLMADVPRSSMPARRVTISHLFESGDHRSAGSGADKWDRFMEKFRGKQDEKTYAFNEMKNKEPLISLADFNLALGAYGPIGDLKSPFYSYLTENSSRGFYNTSNEEDEERLRNLMFVTDSLEAPRRANATNRDGKQLVDLNDEQYQPFERNFLEQTKPDLARAFGVTGGGLKSQDWIYYLSGLGTAALYDYLDPDRVPISLAIPTLERTPMFCGVSPHFEGSQFALTREWKWADAGKPRRSGDQDDGAKAKGGDTREVHQTVVYKISPEFFKGYQTGMIRSLVCFPFAHPDPADGAFKSDGRFSFFFTEGKVSLRTHLVNDAKFPLPKQIADSSYDPDTGFFNVKLPDQNVSFAGRTMNKESDALKVLDNPLQAGIGAIGTKLMLDGNEFLRVDYTWTQTYQEKVVGGLVVGGTWEPGWDQAYANLGKPGGVEITGAHSILKPTIWANGSLTANADEDFKSDGNLVNFLKSGGAKDLTLRAAVWLRLRDNADKTVDLVPACYADDLIQNPETVKSTQMMTLAQDRLGAASPVMLFETGVGFTFSLAKIDELVDQPINVELKPRTAIVGDPRFNYAPEHWHAIGEELTEENWLQANGTGTSPTGKDNDIFMATSDSGYLQSKYELAFLPRFTALNGGGDPAFGNYKKPELDADRIPDKGSEVNEHLMWLTFDAVEDNRTAFHDLPWINEGHGVRVNPYSDMTNVLMAAFANTPRDWRFASTNSYETISNGKGAGKRTSDLKAADFNAKYAINAYGKDIKLGWRDLQHLAGRFSDQVRSGGGRDWEVAWDELGWNTSASDANNRQQLCGVKLEENTTPLWTADRKFLHGFWHDCFGAKQQLYLIFVRAEPTMMGGGGGGQMPPQLGGRAMALVWRDPTKSAARGRGAEDGMSDAPSPHQTRVLFYRQFE